MRMTSGKHIWVESETPEYNQIAQALGKGYHFYRLSHSKAG